MGRKIKIVYVTSSKFKKEENAAFVAGASLSDGTPVRDAFEFDLRSAQIKELLEVDLSAMVCAEVTEAYCQWKVPCIVEHAGLIFEDFLSQSYPGGLTKSMWNALTDRFITETHAQGRRAVARAVVAYCDGHEVRTFVGEVKGHIAHVPRGSRDFYWDTIFVPDDPSGSPGRLTYAEIVDEPNMGIATKALMSQSSIAMLKFLEFRRRSPLPRLWDGIAS
jgi:inosine/xanthosine triphosphate pyrophosphatase family protein